MKPVKDYKTIDRFTDLILFEDGSCRFKKYPSQEVSREDYSNEFEAQLTFNCGAIEWISEQQ